ncbi:hypothetical protein BGE01nite_34070 [Brevifollis gellanilyticus]|uniref:Uncharacterized protein n=1 Tax=Brevifollis gellanilyticus TaxID=748831 RepID=A0A512MBK7_9BACT|nr:hypothetical protein BGE01nite_34070 [Brevifollis gellanilyticus]
MDLYLDEFLKREQDYKTGIVAFCSALNPPDNSCEQLGLHSGTRIHPPRQLTVAPFDSDRRIPLDISGPADVWFILP